MWAVLDFDNKTVVGLYPPDYSEEFRLKDANGRMQIFMTPENSPAYIGGIYVNEKFYPPEGVTNG